MLAHHRVVSAVFARSAGCLPARFPTLVGDRDALREHIEAKRRELTAQLERVRGHCELAVTAVWLASEESSAPIDVEATAPGRRYLLQRRAAMLGSDRRHARALEIADEIERAVSSAVVEVKREMCPSPRVAVSLSMLVERPNAGAILARLPREEHDVRILVHGPWPPYTFAGARSD
jgi:hypothetical protein